MKNKMAILIAGFLLSLNLNAQTELSLNISNLLINEANFVLEKGVQENLSIGVFASYVYGLPPTDNIQFLNNNFYFGPEVRYYVSPKNGLDLFFIGLYLKEAIGTVNLNDNYYDYYGIPPTNSGTSMTYSKLAFGLNIGSKWITRNNITYGMNFGIGRNLYSSYSNEALRDYYFDQNTIAKYFDFRFGFNIGFRFK